MGAGIQSCSHLMHITPGCSEEAFDSSFITAAHHSSQLALDMCYLFFCRLVVMVMVMLMNMSWGQHMSFVMPMIMGMVGRGHCSATTLDEDSFLKIFFTLEMCSEKLRGDLNHVALKSMLVFLPALRDSCRQNQQAKQ